MAHPGGRPRECTPEKEELIALGEKLVKWATEETEELRIRFPQFYCEIHGYVEKEWDLMKRKEEFVPYYEKARSALATKLLKGEIKEGLAQRFMRVYCKEVKAEEDDTLRFKNDLAKELEAYKKSLSQGSEDVIPEKILKILELMKQ